MAKVKTWDDHKAECEAIAKGGIKILGFVGEWKGSLTKLRCSCSLHGEWSTTTITNFKAGKSCPECGKGTLKEDSYHIENFISTGKFTKGTEFRRISSVIWEYTCPVCSKDEYVKAGVCSGVFRSTHKGLAVGKLRCRCSSSFRYTRAQWEYRISVSCRERGYEFLGFIEEGDLKSRSVFEYSCPLHGVQKSTPSLFLRGYACPLCAGHSQREGYINAVVDGTTPAAIKFGVSVKSDKRIRKQNQRNTLQMRCLHVYDFETVDNCKGAEKACLSEMECGILSKRELQDGWSETTSIANLEKIMGIYERFGGVRRAEKPVKQRSKSHEHLPPNTAN